MRSLLLWLCALGAVGCGGPKRTGTRPESKIGEDPVSHVELVIAALSRTEAEQFKRDLEAQGDISNLVLKSHANLTATFELDLRGCECDLPAKIAKLRAPGFRYEGRTTRVRYTAYDNQAPSVSFVFPERDRVVTERELLVTIEVPESDVADVLVGASVATRLKPGIYRAKVLLEPGKNELVARARDHEGNEGSAKLNVMLEKPQQLDAIVKVVVEGIAAPGSSVLVGGAEVTADGSGKYRIEVPLRKGQTQVEIVSIDKHGNKTVTLRELGQ